MSDSPVIAGQHDLQTIRIGGSRSEIQGVFDFSQDFQGQQDIIFGIHHVALNVKLPCDTRHDLHQSLRTSVRHEEGVES